MDEKGRFEYINGKKVGVILNFDLYPEKVYKEDFERFVNYQKKLSLTGEVWETYFKFYKQIKEFKEIPYGIFRDYSFSFFSKIVFELLKNNPGFIVSNSLNIQIKLIQEEDTFQYRDKVSDAENACFYGAGSWFIQLIVAPFFYLKHIDFNYIMRFLLHELTHFIDHNEGKLLWEKRYKYKLGELMKNTRDYSLYSPLFFLYYSMFNLREEGLADFVARMNSPMIEINMGGIKEYNKNLDKLTKLTNLEECRNFYEKDIGWNNLTPSGEFANGRFMCLFIALYVAKRRKSPYYINLEGKNIFNGYQFKNLDKLLSSNRVIFISNLSKDVINEAITYIRPTAHYYFIRLYEGCCKNLGISDKNRVMTEKRFYKLKKQAIAYAKSERKGRLGKEGFRYIE